MDLIGQLAQNGLLALLLAISLLAIGVLYRENRTKTKDYNDLQEKRLLDAVQYRDIYTQMSKDNQVVLQQILTLVQVLDNNLRKNP